MQIRCRKLNEREAETESTQLERKRERDCVPENPSLLKTDSKADSKTDSKLLDSDLKKIESWDWTCNNILYQMLKLLESCIQENFSTVTIILLGKLGRLGVDANGYENNGVENLKSTLSAFLCQSSSRKLGMPSQIATVNALLGLLPLNFEEIIKCSVAELLPAAISQSDPADCTIRKWFSMLSSEQQSLSFSLLQSSGVQSRII